MLHGIKFLIIQPKNNIIIVKNMNKLYKLENYKFNLINTKLEFSFH